MSIGWILIPTSGVEELPEIVDRRTPPGGICAPSNLIAPSDCAILETSYFTAVLSCCCIGKEFLGRETHGLNPDVTFNVKKVHYQARHGLSSQDGN